MKPSDLSAVVAVYRIHWGFSSRAPWGSVVQPSYTLPPPTTIVGALAKAAHDLGLLGYGEFYEVNLGNHVIVASSAAKLVEEYDIVWASAAWMRPAIRTGIPIAYFTAPYRSNRDIVETLFVKGRPTRELFMLYELGYSVSPQGILAIVVITPQKYSEKIALLAAHIARIGSKESFVDPLYSAVHNVMGISQTSTGREDSEILSAWLTPSECILSFKGNYVVEKTPLPYATNEWLCWYSARPCPHNSLRIKVLKEAIHPKYPGWIKADVDRSKCALFFIELGKPKKKITSSYPVLESFTTGLSRIVLPRVVVERNAF